MPIEDEDVIKSVQRVFDILRYFDRSRRSVRAAQVAEDLGYPLSSTNSLLHSMVARGYLIFDPVRRTYFPSLLLNRRTSWLDREWYGTGRLRDLTRHMQEVTGEVVTLSCQNDLQMTFVDIIAPAGAGGDGVEAEEGSLAPLFCSSIGAAALSRHSDRQIACLVSRYNRRTYRESAKANVSLILPLVRQARTSGHVAAYGLYREQAGAIAWALPSRRGGPPIVLAVAGPRERVHAAEGAIVAAGRSAIRRFKSAGV